MVRGHAQVHPSVQVMKPPSTKPVISFMEPSSVTLMILLEGAPSSGRGPRNTSRYTEGLIFDQVHQVGYSNCQALVRVLYLSIDLDHLPSSSKDVAKFIMQLIADPSPCWNIRPNTPYGVAFQVKESLGILEIAKKAPPIIREPVVLDNEEG